MNKKGYLIAILTVAATVAMAAPKTCKMGSGNGKMMCGGKGQMMGRCSCEGPMPAIMNLDLTQEQRIKMNELMMQWHKEKAEMMQDNGKPMMAAFHDGKFDREVFMTKYADMSDNMSAKKADQIEKMYDLLTPEQKKALETKSK
ncbi:MAG: Spy/CpxP family protein refolding chaperone [Sulfurovaceae bacterium]|nr:Spy/CpxP family protein refolding chaperone [Sulfurovaceae bacterium]